MNVEPVEYQLLCTRTYYALCMVPRAHELPKVLLTVPILTAVPLIAQLIHRYKCILVAKYLFLLCLMLSYTKKPKKKQFWHKYSNTYCAIIGSYCAINEQLHNGSIFYRTVCVWANLNLSGPLPLKMLQFYLELSYAAILH